MKKKEGSLEKVSNRLRELMFSNIVMWVKEDIRRVVEGLKENTGEFRVLVNNAGIIRRRKGEEIKISDWDDVFRLILVVLLFFLQIRF